MYNTIRFDIEHYWNTSQIYVISDLHSLNWSGLGPQRSICVSLLAICYAIHSTVAHITDKHGSLPAQAYPRSLGLYIWCLAISTVYNNLNVSCHVSRQNDSIMGCRENFKGFVSMSVSNLFYLNISNQINEIDYFPISTRSVRPYRSKLNASIGNEQ